MVEWRAKNRAVARFYASLLRSWESYHTRRFRGCTWRTGPMRGHYEWGPSDCMVYSASVSMCGLQRTGFSLFVGKPVSGTPATTPCLNAGRGKGMVSLDVFLTFLWKAGIWDAPPPRHALMRERGKGWDVVHRSQTLAVKAAPHNTT